MGRRASHEKTAASHARADHRGMRAAPSRLPPTAAPRRSQTSLHPTEPCTLCSKPPRDVDAAAVATAKEKEMLGGCLRPCAKQYSRQHPALAPRESTAGLRNVRAVRASSPQKGSMALRQLSAIAQGHRGSHAWPDPARNGEAGPDTWKMRLTFQPMPRRGRSEPTRELRWHRSCCKAWKFGWHKGGAYI